MFFATFVAFVVLTGLAGPRAGTIRGTQEHKDGFSHEGHKGHKEKHTKKLISLCALTFVSSVTFVVKPVFVASWF